MFYKELPLLKTNLMDILFTLLSSLAIAIAIVGCLGVFYQSDVSIVSPFILLLLHSLVISTPLHD
jgi:hypothetical protein